MFFINQSYLFLSIPDVKYIKYLAYVSSVATRPAYSSVSAFNDYFLGLMRSHSVNYVMEYNKQRKYIIYLCAPSGTYKFELSNYAIVH